ncbi:MAG: hypothetical protein H0V88_03265 [Pyrinomonadaceae bacterium]|nr:hypothetical protein [Pyrinomonadaceae bacterium]
MKFKSLLAIFLIALSFAASPSRSAINASGGRGYEQTVQNQTGALERGYGAGYSDGYQQGWRDSSEGAERAYRDKEDYRQADRAYANSYGSREDYRDGYRQGFARGYETGYDRRAFDSTIPPGLARSSSSSAADTTSSSETNSNNAGETSNTNVNSNVLRIPANAEMRVELLNNLGTDVNVRGDRFQARVLDPVDYKDAIVEGRVISVRRPGRVRGTSELQLSFDAIRLPDNRTANFKAQVVEVLETRGETGAGRTDTEGGVRGRSSTVGDAIKVGTGAAVGAVIGAITGGGKGAGVGAVVGGAIGAGGVLSTRGKEIKLPRGTQLRIRTSDGSRIE